MSRAVLLILLLIVSTYNSKNTSNYSLTPSIPPKAFVGQYYTCDFRVQGLNNPTYKFTNLPSFLRWSSSGRIEGTPDKRGTFTITVNYNQGKKTGETQLILSVSDPDRSTTLQNTTKKQPQPKGTNVSVETSKQYPDIPCIYYTGDDIFLNLPYYFDLPSNIWNYQQLPSDLIGWNNGSIRGSFYNEGLYSFGAIYSDENGKTASFIITLNIQPSYYYDYWGGYGLQTVPVKDSCRCYTKAVQTQKLATTLYLQSKDVAQKAQKRVSQLKDFLSKQAIIMTLAQNTLKTQTEIKQLTFAKQCDLVKKEQSGKDNYFKAKSNLQLATINYNNVKCSVQNLTQKAIIAEQSFNKSKTTLQAANKEFIQAQNASTSAANQICALQVKIVEYKDDIKSAFNAVGLAKQYLQNYQNNFTGNSFDSSNAQNAKDIASMENDIASSVYHTKEDASNKALINLKNANQNVSDIRDDLSEAAALLGAAKFGLTQAMNQLLVAQAAKAQSDKNMAIMSTYAVNSQSNGTSTFIFGGCDKANYPSFSGTLAVNEVLSSGVRLVSGHTLVYGNCSKTVQVSKGDMIKFDGYLKDGVIHGLSVSK